MSASLIEHVHQCLTPAAIDAVSAFLDERSVNTEEAIRGTVPALLGGLIDRTSTPASVDTLLTVINRVGQSVDLGELALGQAPFDDLMRSGHKVLGTIFGGMSRDVVAQVAAASGLRVVSASALTAILAPIVLAVIGREVASNRLSAPGVVRLFADQLASVARAMPASLWPLFTGASGVLDRVILSLGEI
jgi:OmpA-OmpF porin, OOP family